MLTAAGGRRAARLCAVQRAALRRDDAELQHRGHPLLEHCAAPCTARPCMYAQLESTRWGADSSTSSRKIGCVGMSACALVVHCSLRFLHLRPTLLLQANQSQNALINYYNRCAHPPLSAPTVHAEIMDAILQNGRDHLGLWLNQASEPQNRLPQSTRRLNAARSPSCCCTVHLPVSLLLPCSPPPAAVTCPPNHPAQRSPLPPNPALS